MTDPYRLRTPDEAVAARINPRDTPARPSGRRSFAIRPVLWILIAVGAVANTWMSLAGHVLASAAVGVATLVCVVTLVLHHLRHRSERR